MNVKKNKIVIPVPTLLIASILIIIQHVLTRATVIPQFSENPSRYYLYYFLKAISIVGLNLIPLFLGYYYQVFLKKNILRKLGSFYLIFFTAAMLCNLFFYVLRSQLNIRDFWVVFFPISQNYFTFAVSCTLGLLLISKTTERLEELTNSNIIKIMVVLSSLLVVLPTIFGKDLWGFQDGQNIIWIFYLIFLGYGINRLNISEKFRNTYLHLFLSIFILFFSIFLMTNISQLLRGNTTTAFRFCVPYTVTAMYFTLSLFFFLEKTVQKYLSIKMTLQSIATFLISTQVILNWPLVNYMINNFYKKAFPNSGSKWIIQIGLFVLIYIFSTIIVGVISLLLQRNSFYRRLEMKITFSSYEDFIKKLLTIQNWLYKRRKIIFVTVFFYLFSIVQFLLTFRDFVVPKEVLKQLILILSKYQSTLVLTVLIIMMFFMLLFLLTNRFWFSFTLTLVINLLLTISTVLKITLREEPILPSDLKMLNGLSEILDMISPIIIIVAVALLIFLVVSTTLVQRRASEIYYLKVNRKKRLISISILLLAFSSIFFINHKNSPSYFIVNFFKVNKTFFNQKEAVKSNGPVIQFLINVDVDIMKKPEGYSKTKIKTIMKKYDKEAQTINAGRNSWSNNQTFIFCLSESFSDPSRVPKLVIKNNPIPYIQNLKKENTSGVMMSAGYGGGTANMEWEGLTGLNISNLSETLVTPYTQLVDQQDISPNITNLFQEKIAIHPFTASLYKRKETFKKFGFQKFYYEGSPNELEYIDKIDDSPRISDESAFKETLKHINENTDKTQFIQLSTMQNHMPYSDYYKASDFDFEGSAVISSRKQELKTYMQGIHYTDQAMKKFIAELDKINKPITFVFYGDHLPSIYSGLKMNQYGLELHQTDYFIYSNKYSREQSKNLNKKVVSTNDFPSMALEQANIKVTPYYALLTDVTNHLPTATNDPYNSVSNRYNGSQVFVTEKNELKSSNDLTKKQKELLKDYKLIQYDLTAGEQYSAKWASQKSFDY